MQLPTEYKLPEMLAGLVDYCEKTCLAACCGIDAFDFSPLHVASYISAFKGQIGENDVAEWEALLAEVESAIQTLEPNEDGLICYIANVGQYLRRAHIEVLIAEIRHSIRAAPEMLKRSNELASVTPAYKFIKDDLRRSPIKSL